MHLTESAHKLPKELIIPNDRLHLLNSIGQGETGVCILHLYSTTLMYINIPDIKHRCLFSKLAARMGAYF